MVTIATIPVSNWLMCHNCAVTILFQYCFMFSAPVTFTEGKVLLLKNNTPPTIYLFVMTVWRVWNVIVWKYSFDVIVLCEPDLTWLSLSMACRICHIFHGDVGFQITLYRMTFVWFGKLVSFMAVYVAYTIRWRLWITILLYIYYLYWGRGNICSQKDQFWKMYAGGVLLNLRK